MAYVAILDRPIVWNANVLHLDLITQKLYRYLQAEHNTTIPMTYLYDIHVTLPGVGIGGAKAPVESFSSVCLSASNVTSERK
jgi:hypothetical protein